MEQKRLQEHISLRIFKDILNQVDEVVENNKLKYENRGHFIRCAIMKLLKEEYPKHKLDFI